MGDTTRILAIETSCDETAAAVVSDGRQVLSSVVSSQIDPHQRFGGVVPEIASRAHIEMITPVVAQAMVEGGFASNDHPEAVAATVGPGLVGALLVGVSTAKAMALVWGVPFVGVNHLEGHLYASFLEEPDIELPVITLLVSGGHTMLILVRDFGKYEILAETVDDAAGEAFDKVARTMGLGYPGGPVIDRMAVDGDPNAIAFPRAMRNDNSKFSFSGIKTAVANYLRNNPEADLNDVAASFQEAVVDSLITKARHAAREHNAKGLCLGGGVAANSALRERTCDVGIEDGLRVFLPSREMCTDNAAMIAAAAYHRLRIDGPSSLSMGASPGLRLASTL